MQEGGLSQLKLPAEILNLPAGHLQLSQRAQFALKRRGTIKKLVAEIQTGRTAWTNSVRSEILSVLAQLTECLQSGLEKGWDQFRKARRKMASPMVIYFTSFAFDRMHYSVQDLSIGTLHMSGRARASLADAELKTLGDLIDSAARGLALSHPAGFGTCLEIIDTLEAISIALEANGKCAWDKYADSRRVILLPRNENHEFIAEKYLEAFPGIIKAAARVDFGEAGLAFTSEHLLCADDQRVPLINIGNRFGMSSSTASRVRKAIVLKFRSAFLCDDYTGCRFRFRSEFTWPIRILGTELSRAKGRTIAYSEWKGILRHRWLTRFDCLRSVERGILEILGFQLIRFDQPRLRPLVLPLSRNAEPVRAAMLKAHLLLTTESLSKVELREALERDCSNGELRKSDIHAVMQSLRGFANGWRLSARTILPISRVSTRPAHAVRSDY